MSRKDTYAAFWEGFISIANSDPLLSKLHEDTWSARRNPQFLDADHNGKKHRYNIWWTRPRGGGPGAPYAHVAIGRLPCRSKRDFQKGRVVQHPYGNLRDMDRSHWPNVARLMIDAM